MDMWLLLLFLVMRERSRAPEATESKIARAGMPPGASLFSTLFYVAAIGGK
jgi:hypothetical protein